jgi:hypothetical protein
VIVLVYVYWLQQEAFDRAAKSILSDEDMALDERDTYTGYMMTGHEWNAS